MSTTCKACGGPVCSYCGGCITCGECSCIYDEIDKATAEANAKVADLVAALNELITAADPHTNMSDVVLLDALSRARAVIAKLKGGQA